MRNSADTSAASSCERRVHPPAFHFAQPPGHSKELVHVPDRHDDQPIQRGQRDRLAQNLQAVGFEHLVQKVQDPKSTTQRYMAEATV